MTFDEFMTKWWVILICFVGAVACMAIALTLGGQNNPPVFWIIILWFLFGVLFLGFVYGMFLVLKSLVEGVGR